MLAVGLLFALNAGAALAAPTATTTVATEAAGTTATLNGIVAAESGHETKYDFGYGVTSDFQEFTGATPIKTTKNSSPHEVSAQIAELKPETTYYYAVAAFDTVTNEGKVGAVKSFETTADNGFRFRAVEYPATVDGTLDDETVFEADGGDLQVDCETRDLGGSLSEASASLALTPELSSCAADGLGPVTVEMNSCHYETTVTGEPLLESLYKGNVTVACSEEDDAIEYQISSFGCTVFVGDQENSDTIGFFNDGPAAEREVSMGGVVALDWTTNNEFLCGVAGLLPSGSDGKLRTDSSLSGTNSSESYTEFYIAG